MKYLLIALIILAGCASTEHHTTSKGVDCVVIRVGWVKADITCNWDKWNMLTEYGQHEAAGPQIEEGK